MKKIFISIGFIVCLFSLFPYSKTMANEEAPYKVVHENDIYEVRHYSDRLVVQIINRGDNSFRKLFKYISGQNKNSEKSTYEEGCLSVPNQFAEIDRPSTCVVEYLDYDGKKQILSANGLLSTCIQHEMDHLEGILFIDYLSKLKKSIIVKKLSKKKSNQIVI